MTAAIQFRFCIIFEILASGSVLPAMFSPLQEKAITIIVMAAETISPADAAFSPLTVSAHTLIFIAVKDAAEYKRYHEAGKHASQSRRDGSGDAAYLQSHEGGGIDSPRAGRHL